MITTHKARAHHLLSLKVKLKGRYLAFGGDRLLKGRELKKELKAKMLNGQSINE